MEDKRRKARVQGGWAGPQRVAPHTGSPASRIRIPPEYPGLTRWAKEQPVPQSQFVFKEPSEVTRRIPEPKIIELRLFPNFVDPKEANWMFEQLQREIPWRQRTNIRRDRGQGTSTLLIRSAPYTSYYLSSLQHDHSYQEPRLTAWYGELPYTYSNNTMQPNPHWHPLLTMLKDRIEEVTGYAFNSLLCNLYRNDKDSIDWHSDDEPALGKNPIIASLSFGDTRVFEMRQKPPPEEIGDYTYVEQVRVPLDHGSLLLMEGATQIDWQHRVPKEYHDRGARINLTFRTVYPEPAKMMR
ncbi:alpha-ketoglutarate-dependent dioxygenase alkB homolog 3 isoform X2 [Ambystoma mexicanum]|uniref:alpha-ketoglutarate-dependent dioxygenase alkB homolog 3 isoform X2 n=1 Tax=Ambystoma mexicanum TaxID=8296 RepID=UPI0037E75BD8